MAKECPRTATIRCVRGGSWPIAASCLVLWTCGGAQGQSGSDPPASRAVLMPPLGASAPIVSAPVVSAPVVFTTRSIQRGPIAAPVARQVPHVPGNTPRGSAAQAGVSATPTTADPYPIDLPTALRLAGANNLQIARAATRIDEAQARLAGSRAMWWPSLYGGVGYTRHVGQIQDTRGDVIEVTRSALFVGGGPALGNTITGGAGSPRLGVDFSLTDALFGPLVQRQLVQVANAALASTFNDTLLHVGFAYLELTRAQGQLTVAREAEKNAEELVRQVRNRVNAKTAPPADGLRVEAELADRRRQVFQAEEAIRVASTDLVRLLRLDPTTLLVSAEEYALPVSFVEEATPLVDLINQGLASRPEIAGHDALSEAMAGRWRQEQWRPLIPSLHLGLSAGGLGGGSGSFVGNFHDRADFDALLVWQLSNLGLGNRALGRERAAQAQQATLAAAQVRDLVAAEVAAAYHQVHFRRKQIHATREQIQAAERAVPLNFLGIKGEVLRAIEAQQAIHALAAARYQHLEAIISYNRAQFALWRALGIPLLR